MIYSPTNKKMLLPKGGIYIVCGLQIESHVIKNQENLLSTAKTIILKKRVCKYNEGQWKAKISFDQSCVDENDNSTLFWVQFHNQISGIDLTEKIILGKDVITRKANVFESCIVLTEEIVMKRITEPYCVIHNIHPQQYQTSLDIVSFIKNGHKHIVLISQMQMGKTGCAKSTVYNLINFCGYDSSQLFFICGMNDNNLLNQATVEFDGLIPKGNILFSKKLQSMVLKPSSNPFNFNHCVIFIDESHYASQKDSLIYKFLDNIVGVTADGYFSTWKNKSVVIISISATPMAEIANLNQPNSDKKIAILQPGDDYYGITEMFDKGLLNQAFNLNKQSGIDQFISLVNSVYEYFINKKKQKYCVVRLGSILLKDNLESMIKKKIGDNILFTNHYSGSNRSCLIDFNQIVEHEPDKMCIIWIYDSLRAGKQLNTENIYLVHDSYCSAPDVAAQGLAGRLCGYGKRNHNVICYTNVKSLLKFIDWIKYHYDVTRIPAGSKDIINGFDVNNNSLWQKNIPIIFKMDHDLIDSCHKYRIENGKKKYNVEFKKYCIGKIINLCSTNPIALDILYNYYPARNGGLMIIDHLNKPKSVEKHWQANHNAYVNNKSCHGFVTPNTQTGHDKLYYIFLNLIPNDPSYGFGLICYKQYVNSIANKKSVVSTKPTNITHPEAWVQQRNQLKPKIKILVKNRPTLQSKQCSTKVIPKKIQVIKKK